MKKYRKTIRKISFALLACAAFTVAGSLSSCHKSSNNNATGACTFLFHFHTQIIDSTIGGNTDGYDSNTTGPGVTNTWYLDGLGRRIELFVPQFFVTGIQLVNSNGTIYNVSNAALLKGLDSEDYYFADNVPTGTYTSANFTIGMNNADSTLPPSTNFLSNTNLTGVNAQYNQAYPLESSMWTGSDYYGMKIVGAYDTTAAGTGINPVPFTFNIPNGLTITQQIVLPARGTATVTFPVYIASVGTTNYVHILCDYGKLLTGIVNLKANNSTATNPSLADSLANNLTTMFRYEQ